MGGSRLENSRTSEVSVHGVMKAANYEQSPVQNHTEEKKCVDLHQKVRTMNCNEAKNNVVYLQTEETAHQPSSLSVQDNQHQMIKETTNHSDNMRTSLQQLQPQQQHHHHQQQQQDSSNNIFLSPEMLQQRQSILHNLIPLHLQNNLPLSLPGTLTHNLIPPMNSTTSTAVAVEQVPSVPIPELLNLPVLSVQERHSVPPVYNGVNPFYPGLRVVNQNPPIFAVDNFLTAAECDFLIYSAQDCLGPAPVVGKGAGEVSPSRTSSTCYLAREDLPGYLRKVTLLTGKPVEHCELPQVGRYYPTQQYLQHFDAFDLSNEDGRRFASNGGQRTVTVLVYLNDVARGGATSFPTLNIQVQPRKGTALVFFPATVDGLLDKNALHAALPAVDVKYVSQVWIRQSNYEGLPSKRLFPNANQATMVQQAFANSVTQGGIVGPLPNIQQQQFNLHTKI